MTLKLLSLKNLEKAQDLTGLLAETITMSADHKLFVPTIVDRKLVGEWTTASEIKAGTLLMFGGADSVFLQDILVLVSQADISSEEEVYCLSLAKNHNYFVSELGIIVHNFVPLFVGLSFAFGGGEIVLTGLTATAILGGLFLGASTMKDNSGDFSLKGHGGIVTESSKSPHSSISAGGSPGGPKPPKKDDDEKDKALNKTAELEAENQNLKNINKNLESANENLQNTANNALDLAKAAMEQGSKAASNSSSLSNAEIIAATGIATTAAIGFKEEIKSGVSFLSEQFSASKDWNNN